MMAVDISPREVPRGQAPEFEAVVSNEEGVPVFTSWQPWETPEEAKAAVVQLFSNVEPVVCTITDLAGRKHISEIR